MQSLLLTFLFLLSLWPLHFLRMSIEPHPILKPLNRIAYRHHRNWEPRIRSPLHLMYRLFGPISNIHIHLNGLTERQVNSRSVDIIPFENVSAPVICNLLSTCRTLLPLFIVKLLAWMGFFPLNVWVFCPTSDSVPRVSVKVFSLIHLWTRPPLCS